MPIETLRTSLLVVVLGAAACTGGSNESTTNETTAPEIASTTAPESTTTLYVGDAPLEEAIAAFADCKTPPDSAAVESPQDFGPNTDELEPDDWISLEPVRDTVAAGDFVQLVWGGESYGDDFADVFCWTGENRFVSEGHPLDGWVLVYRVLDIGSENPRVMQPGFNEYADDATPFGGPWGPSTQTRVNVPEFAASTSYLIRIRTTPIDIDNGYPVFLIPFNVE